MARAPRAVMGTILEACFPLECTLSCAVLSEQALGLHAGQEGRASTGIGCRQEPWHSRSSHTAGIPQVAPDHSETGLPFVVAPGNQRSTLGGKCRVGNTSCNAPGSPSAARAAPDDHGGDSLLLVSHSLSGAVSLLSCVTILSQEHYWLCHSLPKCGEELLEVFSSHPCCLTSALTSAHRLCPGSFLRLHTFSSETTQGSAAHRSAWSWPPWPVCGPKIPARLCLEVRL